MLTKSSPVPLPTAGGVFYTPAELAVWRSRVSTGPFVKDGDYTSGSPGDWNRITANAKLMTTTGEAAVTSATTLTAHGTLARDAAFYQLIKTDGTTTAAVKKYLLAQISNPVLDFPTTLCFRDAAGATQDGWFFNASWLLRYIATYDFMRGNLTNAERLNIENFIRRNAYFLAAHNDWGLAFVFPSRLTGNYTSVGASAAAKTAASIWLYKQFDTNSDCKFDANDSPTNYVDNSYIAANGTVGPKLSVLSQWYNNRRSTVAAAFGSAGVLLGDADLIASSKRYFMEWLTYSVWEDGSQGEYSRNGNYCIGGQGLIYSAFNEQGATLMARILARQGDRSMANFSTTAGMYGSESSSASKAKSLEMVISTRLNLITGQTKWFYHQPWKSVPTYNAIDRIGAADSQYLGTGKPIDSYHELGLLQGVGLFPRISTTATAVIMRDQKVTTLRFPGSTGNMVSPGYGNWTDAFNALPAALLIRP